MSIDYLLENERALSDSPDMVDLNNFILNGNSRVPSDKERQMLNNVIAAIFADN